jgi:hypothetical protein
VDQSVVPPKRLVSGQWLYWSSFLLAVLLGVIVTWSGFAAAAASDQYATAAQVLTAGPMWVGLTIVFFGPLWLLAACVVMAMQIVIRPATRRRSIYWKHFGWITLSIVVGSVLGIAVMWVIAMTYFR